MPSIAALQEQRAARVDAIKAIVTKAETENRNLSSEENSAFDAGRADVERIDRDIRNAQFLAEAERRGPGDPVNDNLQGADLTRYSAARAIRCAMTGQFDGIEGEMHAELSRGRETRGIMIPTTVLLGETRTQTVGTAAAGGHTVATQLAPLADRINRPALKVEAMGATVMRGLTGFLDLPNLAGSGTTAWVAEDGNATRSAATFSKVSMAPKTVTAEYQLSRRLILQSNEAIENLLRSDLGQLLAQALDGAAIKGGGTNQPTGVIATAGVAKVATQTAFSDTTADLIAALEMDDITGTAAFLTHPGVINACRKIRDGDGHIMPLAELFHDQRVEATTQVPTNIGTGNNKKALIFGLWSQLVIGYWSAVDVLVNPYHADVASNGGALIHAFLDADVAVRNPAAFRYSEI